MTSSCCSSFYWANWAFSLMCSMFLCYARSAYNVCSTDFPAFTTCSMLPLPNLSASSPGYRLVYRCGAAREREREDYSWWMSYQLPARFSKGANRAGWTYFFFIHLWIIIIWPLTHSQDTKSTNTKINGKEDTVLLFGWIGLWIKFGMMDAYIELNEQLGTGPKVGPKWAHHPPHPIWISKRGHHSVQFYHPAALSIGRNCFFRSNTSQIIYAHS